MTFHSALSERASAAVLRTPLKQDAIVGRVDPMSADDFHAWQIHADEPVGPAAGLGSEQAARALAETFSRGDQPAVLVSAKQGSYFLNRVYAQVTTSEASWRSRHFGSTDTDWVEFSDRHAVAIVDDSRVPLFGPASGD